MDVGRRSLDLKKMDWAGVATFLDVIQAGLESVGIAVDAYELDHVCYRVASLERYKAVKCELLELRSAVLLSEAQIGGRAIASFKLKTPISWRGRSITVIEVPSPKPGRAYAEGWEHAEFVIAETFAAFAARHPRAEFDWRGAEKVHNPDLALALPSPSGNFAVKFHHQALEAVIAEETAGPSDYS